MSILLDTDLLSLLERKRVPARLVTWLEENDTPLFVSVVSFAELQYGVEQGAGLSASGGDGVGIRLWRTLCASFSATGPR